MLGHIRQRLVHHCHARLGTLGIAAGFGVSLSLTPTAALACGACVATPQPPASPPLVLQSSERILFVRHPTEPSISVHVEIRYTGLAKDFGWILPVTKVPKVSVSSDLVFRRLDQLTAPTFRVKQGIPNENCRDPWLGCASVIGEPQADDTALADVTASDVSASTDVSVIPTPDVVVVDSGQAGPYDYVVLDSTDASQLALWLNQAGYVMPPAGEQIIASHLAKGDVFVAVKLQNGKGIETIRPLRLDMPTDEACVPLRLTSIAAVYDMDVQAFLIGPGRGIPKNMLHVRPNPLRFAWPSEVGPAEPVNYEQVLSAAIDEADGSAFSTEYAQKAEDTATLTAGRDDQLALAEGVKSYTDLALWAVDARKLATDAMLETLLTDLNLVAATGLKPTTLLAALLSCGTAPSWNGGPASCLAQAKGPFGWEKLAVDGAGLRKYVDEAWWQAVSDAETALEGSGGTAQNWLTRLRVRLDPIEMDRDPLFGFNQALDPVLGRYEMTLGAVCHTGWVPTSKLRWSFPGLGSWVSSGPVGDDARFTDMPFALAIELLDESGPVQVVAPSQAPVLAQAVIGAKPGEPQLPPDIVVLPGTGWAPPASDPQVTTLGAWPKPWGCTPKPGWEDGAPPPDGQAPPPDAGVLDVPGIDSWNEPGDTAADTAGAKADKAADSGCQSGRSPDRTAAALAVAALVGLGLVRRRRVA